MFNFIDHLHCYSNHTCDCVGRGPSTLLCPGAYDAVKMALSMTDG